MEIQKQQSANQSINQGSNQEPNCAHGLQQRLPHKLNFVKCEGLMVATLKIAIFCDVMPCGVANMSHSQPAL